MSRRTLLPGLGLLAGLLLLLFFFSGPEGPGKEGSAPWKQPSSAPSLLEKESVTSREDRAAPSPLEPSSPPSPSPATQRIPSRHLDIRILDPEGNGIEGAAVRIFPLFSELSDPTFRKGTTGPDGLWKTSFPTLLPLGIEASAAGFWKNFIKDRVSRKDAETIVVTLARRKASAFSLQVVDQADDSPLADARIFTDTDPPKPVGITGGDGRLAVQHQPAGRNLRAHAEGHFPGPVYLPAGALDPEAELMVKLAPLSPIEVVFMDAEDFTPLHPLAVRLLAGGRQLPASFQNGAWVIPPIPVLAWKTKIGVEAKGYLPTSFFFAPGRNHVRLQPSASLVIRVHGEASGLRVQAEPAGIPETVALQPDNGGSEWLATLPAVPAGDLGLFLLRGREIALAREVRALQPGEEREIRIALEEGEAWTIRATDEAGTPAPSAFVRILGGNLVDEGITDEGGKAVLRAGKPSFLGVLAAGFLPRLLLEPSPSPAGTLEVKLKRAISLHGHIEGPPGLGGTWNWAGWTVTWFNSHEETWTNYGISQDLPPAMLTLSTPFFFVSSLDPYPVRPDGSFEIDGLADVDLEIEVHPPEKNSRAASAVRKAGSKKEFVLRVSKLPTILFFDRPLEERNRRWVAGVVGKKGEKPSVAHGTRNDFMERNLPLGKGFVYIEAQGYQPAWLEIWREPGFNELIHFSLQPLTPKDEKQPVPPTTYRFLKKNE